MKNKTGGLVIAFIVLIGFAYAVNRFSSGSYNPKEESTYERYNQLTALNCAIVMSKEQRNEVKSIPGMNVDNSSLRLDQALGNIVGTQLEYAARATFADLTVATDKSQISNNPDLVITISSFSFKYPSDLKWHIRGPAMIYGSIETEVGSLEIGVDLNWKNGSRDKLSSYGSSKSKTSVICPMMQLNKRMTEQTRESVRDACSSLLAKVAKSREKLYSQK